MKTGSQQLVGLPKVLPAESPASWLTRAALSQGVAIGELLKFAGIANVDDIDLAFLGARFRDLANLFGFDKTLFHDARQIVGSLTKLYPKGGRFLLKTPSGRPRYRVCPRCAATQKTPYFAIHCRFAVWRFCPDHRCMMEDACWNCEATIDLPGSLAGGGPMQGRCAYLSQCLKCGRPFFRGAALSLEALASSLTEFEFHELMNGRAALAALYQRRVMLAAGIAGRFSSLREYERLGILGTRKQAPTADALRARDAARIASLSPDATDSGEK